jgi:hypothetical protein
MAFAKVNDWSNYSTSNSTSITVTVGTNATANNLLVAIVAVWVGGDSFTTPTDWTLVDSHSTGTDGYAVYYKLAAGTSADDFDPSWTDAGFPGAHVIEYSGNATSGVLAQSSENIDDIATNVQTHTTNSITPTTGNLVAALFASIEGNKWNKPNTWASTGGTLALAFQETNEVATPYTAQTWIEAPSASSISETFSTIDTGDYAYSVITEFAAATAGGETTTITASNFTYAGGTVGSSLTANRATTLTGSNFTYSGATIGSTASDNVTTAVTGVNFTYSGATVTSSFTEDVLTTVTGVDYTYSGGAIASSVGGEVTTVVTGVNFTYLGGTITSTFEDHVTTTVTGTNFTFSGGTIGSTFEVNLYTPVSGPDYTYSGGTITSTAEGAEVLSTGFLPSLNQRNLTPQQLARRRNQRYRYLKGLE